MTTATATSGWEPLSEVRKSLRIKWYRSPIGKPTLWALMERSDRKGFAQALGHVGLVVALGALTAVAFEQGWWAVFGVALWLFGSVIRFMPGNATHELAQAPCSEHRRSTACSCASSAWWAGGTTTSTG